MAEIVRDHERVHGLRVLCMYVQASTRVHLRWRSYICWCELHTAQIVKVADKLQTWAKNSERKIRSSSCGRQWRPQYGRETSDDGGVCRVHRGNSDPENRFLHRMTGTSRRRSRTHYASDMCLEGEH